MIAFSIFINAKNLNASQMVTLLAPCNKVSLRKRHLKSSHDESDGDNTTIATPKKIFKKYPTKANGYL